MPEFRMAKQVDRVPSMVVPLDREEELRFERLMDSITLVDMHEHPMVLTEDVHQLGAYFRTHRYEWAYESVRHGGWTTVATANGLSCGANASEGSYSRFEDLLEEVALMRADLAKRSDVMRIASADDVAKARQRGSISFLPTVEHLALSHELHRVDVLYGVGA